MKISIISQYWEPDINGDVTRLENAINEFQNAKCEIVLVTSTPHYPDGDKRGYRFRLLRVERKNPGLTVVRLQMPSLPHRNFATRFTLYFWFALAATIPALVYGKGSNYVWAFSMKIFSTYAALICKVFWGSKIISDVTDVWPEAVINTGYEKPRGRTYGISRFLSKTAYLMSDKITTLTPNMSRIFVENHGIAPSKLFEVPNIGKPLELNSENNILTKGTKILRVLYYGNLGTNYDFSPLVELA
jgi:hypothetical protein